MQDYSLGIELGKRNPDGTGPKLRGKRYTKYITDAEKCPKCDSKLVPWKHASPYNPTAQEPRPTTAKEPDALIDQLVD
jgi:hypothetical protein